MNVMSIVGSTLLMVMLLAPVAALAQIPLVNELDVVPGNNLRGAIAGIVNAFLALAAIVAAVYIIIGGVKYITSAGDEDKAGEAKQTILYALIGLVVIGLAAVLANFVITAINTTG